MLARNRIGEHSLFAKGVVLGYAAFTEDEIRRGVKRLAEALQSLV